VLGLLRAGQALYYGTSALVAIGAYSAENNPVDVLMVFVFGALGVAMERFGYNRPALILGFVLGETIERYFQVSINAYGPGFLLRPISLFMSCLPRSRIRSSVVWLAMICSAL